MKHLKDYIIFKFCITYFDTTLLDSGGCLCR